MKRDSVQTVTFPILVAASSAREANGHSPLGHRLVRAATNVDARKWIKTEFKSAADHAFLVGLSHVKWGWDEKDEFTLEKGFSKLAPHVESNQPRKPKTMNLSGGLSLTWSGWDVGTVPSMFSQIVSEHLQHARFVMWFSEKTERFLPGLFCPDRKTAVLAMRFMGRILVCPKCDAPFVPTANMGYCSAKHREAHRVERFRWRAKQRSAEG